jgi:carbamoyltransferase
MINWGINALNHGSSLAVFNGDRFISNVFSHSDDLTYDIIADSLRHGYPEKIYWYEKPWVKKARQLRAGQWSRAFDFSVLPRKFVDKLGFKSVPIIYTPHHASHAAAGYYTSSFDHCAVVVLDAIGEFECASIWEGRDGILTKVWSRSYPNSLGLFYSAFTQTLGLIPVKDEGVLQQMAEKGNPKRFYDRVSKYFSGIVALNYNFHKGVRDQYFSMNTEEDFNDLAAAVQAVFEKQISLVMTMAKSAISSDSLVYMGGCAFNSRANTLIEPMWKHIWSLPNPGDPSSSIGAVLYHKRCFIPWPEERGIAKHIKIK